MIGVLVMKKADGEHLLLSVVHDVEYKNITKVICEEKFYDESIYLNDCIKKGEFIRKEIQQNRNRFYDLKPLLAAINEDYNLLGHIIKEFTSMKYQDDLFNNIEKFEKDRDIETLIKYLHKFKGSISHFQVESINNILYELKESCKNSNVVSVNQSLKRLKNEYVELKDFLIEYARKTGD